MLFRSGEDCARGMRDGVLGLGGDYYFGVVRTPPSAKPDDGAFIVFMVGVIWGFYSF